jgi:predicted nuclease of predicted toxin-antitoxin system
VVPLYMDEHVPRAITTGLRLRGVDVLTVQEDNNSGKSDPELLERAVYLKRAIFTNDDDLLVEAAKQVLSHFEWVIQTCPSASFFCHPRMIVSGIRFKKTRFPIKPSGMTKGGIRDDILFLSILLTIS